MSASQHVHAPPTDDELAQLIGAATPHFALQIRDRVAQRASSLPSNAPEQAILREQMARLERLALGGEDGGDGDPDLPARAPLTSPGAP